MKTELETVKDLIQIYSTGIEKAKVCNTLEEFRSFLLEHSLYAGVCRAAYDLLETQVLYNSDWVTKRIVGASYWTRIPDSAGSVSEGISLLQFRLDELIEVEKEMKEENTPQLTNFNNACIGYKSQNSL